jgi:hypothetical protein
MDIGPVFHLMHSLLLGDELLLVPRLPSYVKGCSGFDRR